MGFDAVGTGTELAMVEKQGANFALDLGWWGQEATGWTLKDC